VRRISRLGRGSRSRSPSPFDDLACLAHLLGVRLGELAGADPQLSSRPTRTLPPIAADIAAIGIWLRPAPSTDQR
jgi:hypothetical protein